MLKDKQSIFWELLIYGSFFCTNLPSTVNYYYLLLKDEPGSQKQQRREMLMDILLAERNWSSKYANWCLLEGNKKGFGDGMEGGAGARSQRGCSSLEGGFRVSVCSLFEGEWKRKQNRQ